MIADNRDPPGLRWPILASNGMVVAICLPPSAASLIATKSLGNRRNPLSLDRDRRMGCYANMRQTNGQVWHLHTPRPQPRGGRPRNGSRCSSLMSHRPTHVVLHESIHLSVIIPWDYLQRLPCPRTEFKGLKAQLRRERSIAVGRAMGELGSPPISRVLSSAPRGAGQPFLWATRCRAALAAYPGATRATPVLPYLALPRMGFAVPSLLPGPRWALTPPFHPCPASGAVGGLFSAAMRSDLGLPHRRGRSGSVVAHGHLFR